MASVSGSVSGQRHRRVQRVKLAADVTPVRAKMAKVREVRIRRARLRGGMAVEWQGRKKGSLAELWIAHNVGKYCYAGISIEREES